MNEQNRQWTVIAPDGTQFFGETPFKAAVQANRLRLVVDPVAAKQFADAIEQIVRENDAENRCLMEEHGTLDCPACGGSGHIGDVAAPSAEPVAPAQPPAPDYSEMSREALERHAARMAQALADDRPRKFWERYALGPLMAPSCLCCGKLPDKVAIQHIELPCIVICEKCRNAATLQPPAQPPAAQAADVGMPPLPRPYSNIYPEDLEDCCHYICYTPSTQPGGGRPNHQPVYTAGQMRAYARSCMAAAPKGPVPDARVPLTEELIDAVFKTFAGTNDFGVPYLQTYAEGFRRIARTIEAVCASPPEAHGADKGEV